MRYSTSKQQQNRYQQIIRQRYSTMLRELNLSCETYHWKNILKYKNWEQLQSLDLSSNKITDDDITIITFMKWPSLKQLVMSCNYIKDTNRIWETQFPKLAQISLDGNQITTEGIYKIVQTPLTKQLRLLRLSKSRIGSRGAKLLIKADLPVFEVLSAWGCEFSNEGVIHLAKAQWPMLRKCIINQNYIGCDGICALTNFNFPRIKRIFVLYQINFWQVVHIIGTNFHTNTEIGKFHHPNLSINSDIISILKKRSFLQQSEQELIQ